MPERLLEVNIEVDPDKLALERDPTQTVAELSRWAAEEKVRDEGGTLRHSEPRSVLVKRAMTHMGEDVLLVSTRWLADGIQPSG